MSESNIPTGLDRYHTKIGEEFVELNPITYSDPNVINVMKKHITCRFSFSELVFYSASSTRLCLDLVKFQDCNEYFPITSLCDKPFDVHSVVKSFGCDVKFFTNKIDEVFSGEITPQILTDNCVSFNKQYPGYIPAIIVLLDRINNPIRTNVEENVIMKRVAVVLRHSPLHPESIITEVIGEPDFKVDDLDHYFQSEAQRVIKSFTDAFPEFGSESVKWSITIHNVA